MTFVPARHPSRTRRRLASAVAIAAIATLTTSCADDGTPEDQPATVTDEFGTVETPTDGSTRIEPGTNLTPTSDDVPGPTTRDVPGLGDGTGTTTD